MNMSKAGSKFLHLKVHPKKVWYAGKQTGSRKIVFFVKDGGKPIRCIQFITKTRLYKYI